VLGRVEWTLFTLEWPEGHTFPVIPVLLQGADLTPGFLFLNTWIDLRHGLDGLFTAEALNTFERAIKATEPVRYADDSAARMTERAEICPYRGLQIFREEDAAFFVGRKAFAEQLFDFTLGKNLVVVVGSSGSGKSSVVLREALIGWHGAHFWHFVRHVSSSLRV